MILPPPSSSDMVQCLSSMGPVFTRTRMIGGTEGGRNCLVFTLNGANRRLKPTITEPLQSLYALHTSCNSSTVVSNGFSTYSFFPALSAFTTSSACESCLVVMKTVLIVVSSRIFPVSVVTYEKLYRLPISVGDIPVVPALATRVTFCFMSAGSSTFREKEPGPMKPTLGVPSLCPESVVRVIVWIVSFSGKGSYVITAPLGSSSPGLTSNLKASSAF